MTRRAAWPWVAVPLGLLGAVAALSFYTLPLSARWPFSTAIAGGQLWLLLGACTAVGFAALFRADRMLAALALVAVVGAGSIAVIKVPWPSVFLRSQQGALAQIAERAETDLQPPARLPGRWALLSRDGRLREQKGCLFLALWRDWRDESGVALVHCGGARPTGSFQTAAGDSGEATTALGSGWWLVG